MTMTCIVTLAAEDEESTSASIRVVEPDAVGVVRLMLLCFD
jgi:hypothetical protein